MPWPSATWVGLVSSSNRVLQAVMLDPICWGDNNRMKVTTEMRKGLPLVMARAFDILTCPQNHPCYMATKKLCEGSIVDASSFVPLGKAPTMVFDHRIHQMHCPECGGFLFPRSKHNGALFYNRGKLMGDGNNYVEET